MLTILKFKRQKTTFSIPIDLGVKNAFVVSRFTSTLVEIIEQSGGLLLLDDSGEVAEEDEDIEVPKSELMDDEEEKEPKQEEQDRILDLAPADIRIAVPKDKTNPYANNWLEITADSELASILFKDYDIIAFAYGNEDFNVVEAAYEE